MDFYADKLKIYDLRRITHDANDSNPKEGFSFDISYVVKRMSSDYLQRYESYVNWYYPHDSFKFKCSMPIYHTNIKDTGVSTLFYVDGIVALGDRSLGIERWDVDIMQPYILTIGDVVKMCKAAPEHHYMFIPWDSIKKNQESHPSNKSKDILTEKVKKLFPTE